MTDSPSSINADGVSEPFSVERVPWEEFERGKLGSRFRVLSKFGGGSHVGVAYEELPPGKQSNILHYHLLEEEHVFILEGELTLRLGDRAYPMKPGDYVCFPAGQKVGHCLVNHTDRPCRYIVIGENNPHDVAVFPETGRVSVRLTGEGYRKSAVMDYWEGTD
ncbi:cupin domain-containing protein [Inquilinus sp. CA228]|uniref:cupin domain-containing protein n=1 Tax=Inquilinus sp. CA228 TaxID=3455609 RepID=UPI003F8D5583